MAWTYDAVAWLVSLGQWVDWVQVAQRYVNAVPALELAHGPGHLQEALARQRQWAVGLDLSPQMGRLARRRLRRAGLPPRLVRARAQALPFRDGAFPTVVATFPTEFIIDPRTAREVMRVLSPQGRVAVVASCRLLGRDPFSRFLEWLYKVTGQRAPLPAVDASAWLQSGLALRGEWVPVGRSQVLVVLGERQ